MFTLSPSLFIRYAREDSRFVDGLEASPIKRGFRGFTVFRNMSGILRARTSTNPLCYLEREVDRIDVVKKCQNSTQFGAVFSKRCAQCEVGHTA